MAAETGKSGDDPWPTEGDSLIPPEKRKRRRPLPPGSKYLLREGYYRAGELLAEARLDPNNRYRVWPGIIFPMTYCYRHYLELAMKDLIPVLGKLSGMPIKAKKLKKHSLLKLWRKFRERARKAIPPHPDNEPTDDVVEQCIKELDEIDENSQAFRYLTDTKGKPHRLPEIDVRQMRDTMAGLRQYFQGTDDYLDHLLEMRRHIDSMRP